MKKKEREKEKKENEQEKENYFLVILLFGKNLFF